MGLCGAIYMDNVDEILSVSYASQSPLTGSLHDARK
jgi:hypothetical protein